MNSITSALDRPVASPRAHPHPRSSVERLRARVTWAHLALAVLLVGTAAAYVYNLSASGDANSFYAAAVQAGTKSWKAFFFGSLDSSNFITVDKPPASLWVMALSGRIFGFSSWSMLVPQALEGVAAVALLYAAIKRWFGTGAGLAAGALFAITPVAALMFRFNNPDALLVLLLVAGAYCLTRALEKAGTRWVVAAGTMIGFAFLAKMLQAFIVLPGFAAVYLIAAPTHLRRRIWQTLAGGAAVVVSAGWWVAIVALWPVGSRPFIDGSPDNNIFNLITGYNGLQRIFSGGGPGGGGGGPTFSGSTGVFRLFNDLMGGQASWLLPAALLALALGLWARRRAPRTDRSRAALLLWGSWLIVTAIVFSFGQGVIHTYYTVALAPAIGALVAIGGALLWQHRDRSVARFVAAAAVAGTSVWAYVLLDRTPSWEPWLRGVIAATAVLAVLGLLAAPALARLWRRAGVATLVLAAVAALSGPAAYAAQTISTPQTGSIPSAGPASAAGFGGGPGGGRLGGAAGSRFGGLGGAGASARAGGGFPGGALPGGAAPGGAPPSGVRPGGASGFGPPGAGALGGEGARAGRGFTGSPGAGAGGGATASKALVKALKSDSGQYRWVAATSGSQNAATLELATGGDPVMAIGGFNGNGGELTLSQFKQYVAKGEIHYYIASGGAGGGPGGAGATGAAGGRAGAGGAPGSSGKGSVLGGARGAGAKKSAGGVSPANAARSSSQITSWVESHFKKVTISGETVYDLAQPVS